MALYVNNKKVCPTVNPDSNYFHSTIRFNTVQGNYIQLSNGMTGNVPASGVLDFYIYKPGTITAYVYVENSSTPAHTETINVSSSAIQTYQLYVQTVANVRLMSYIGSTVTYNNQTYTIDSLDGVTVVMPLGNHQVSVSYQGHTRTYTINVTINSTICEFLNPYTLPSDYTEVGSIYLNNTGGNQTLASHKCYIDTEDHYKLDDTWIFKLRNFENVSSNNENKGYGGGCKTSTAYNITGGGRHGAGDGQVASYFSGQNTPNVNVVNSANIHYSNLAGKVFTEVGDIRTSAITNMMYINGLRGKNGAYRARVTNYTKGNYPGPDSILIGCDNTNNYAYGSNENVYYYVYIEGTTVSKAMYPAKRNSDNIYGLYDVINDVFYTNDGPGGEAYITEGVD